MATISHSYSFKVLYSLLFTVPTAHQYAIWTSLGEREGMILIYIYIRINNVGEVRAQNTPVARVDRYLSTIASKFYDITYPQPIETDYIIWSEMTGFKSSTLSTSFAIDEVDAECGMSIVQASSSTLLLSNGLGFSTLLKIDISVDTFYAFV